MEFALEAGRARDLWITNADACLRVEIDGREVARAEVARPGGSTSVSVALDGEPVEIERAEVARDLIYAASDGAREREWRLGPDEVFLLGDNSVDSRDSRQMGPIALDRLIGRVLCVAWPPRRIRLLR